MSREVRVRIAPSPTGPFSLGNLRTALFNWLFAKHEGGEFLLRIEDTDKARSDKEFESGPKGILEGLKWLGLDWDNKNIVRQSERGKIYTKSLEALLAKGLAYYCFCTPEELEAERQAQMTQGLAPKYSGKCRNLKNEEIKESLKTNSGVIRFKMPHSDGHFEDMIRGRVPYSGDAIGDIVIAKNLEEPLYNFAVVVDDHDMNITHVIRGEDHLSNTSRQIFIAEALGFPRPHYAHLPLILGPDKKKLSKRFLEGSFFEYKEKGYIPEAMVNFLVLLGWHPREDREVISITDMIKEFSLDRVQKAGGVFDPQKLDWLNSVYLKTMNEDELLNALTPYVPTSWLKKKDVLKKAIALEKIRIKTLSEFSHSAEIYFEVPEYLESLLIWKNTPKDVIKLNLQSIKEILKGDKEVDQKITQLAEERGRGEVFWPLRVALSGKDASPGPLEILSVIGVNEAEKRVEKALKKL